MPIGDPQRFTIAGTVFETQSTLTPASGASVTLVDAKGSSVVLPPTNAAGNFYSTPSQYDPTFPVQVTLLGAGGQSVRMESLIEGNGTIQPNGSCASCHFDPQGPSTPGHLCLVLDDGGTPP